MSRLTPAFISSLMAFFCFGLFTLPVFAANEFVPSQYPTIQAAMNAAVSGDTVFVADGTYSGPGNVDLDFNGKNLTIRGENGPGSTIIDCGGFPSNDGSGNHRGFYAHSGETNIILQNLTIQNGYEFSGGGLYFAIPGSTRIFVCTFKNNSAVFGGGIYNANHTGSNFQVLAGAFTGNISRAGSGGGIYNENDSAGTFALSRCTFTGNQAPGGSGGGVFNNNVNGGTFTLSSCALRNNSVGANGGGLSNFSTGGSSVVTNCLFTGNTVNSGGGTGGQGDGIFNSAAQTGTFAAINCTLTGNSESTSTCFSNADSGSATSTLTNDIFYGDSGGEITGSAATASHCDIQYGYPGTGNLSSDPLFVSSPTDLQLQSASPCLGAGTVTGAPTRTIDLQNRPNPPSMGAYEMQPASLGPTTTTLTSYNNPSIAGQYVNIQASVNASSPNPTGTVTFTVDGTARPPIPFALGRSVQFLTSTLPVGSHTITASYSGDFNFSPSTSAVLTQVVNPHISPVYVSPSGNDSSPGSQAAPKLTLQGGINATLSGDTIIVENGTYSGPGNVDLEPSNNNLTITSQNGAAATIIDCGGTTGSHRGFILQFGETGEIFYGLTIQNGNGSSLNNNVVTGGGAIDNINGTLSVENCVLSSNAGNGGGALYNSGTVRVTKSTLSGNTAGTASGGGVENNGGTLYLANCKIVGNSAGYGGGVYNFIYTSGLLTLVNCLLTGNSASSDGGGLLSNTYYGASTVTDCTFTGNSAVTNSYAGISSSASSGSTLTLLDDIVYGDSGNEITYAGATASYCDVQGGYRGTSNLNIDPVFFSASDFHLQAGSPCLGAGTASGASLETLDGKGRPNPPSIGAYEAGVTGTATTTSTLKSSANPSVFGQSITFTATIAGTSGTPTGTVNFSVDGITLGHAPLSGGSGAFSTSSLAGGSHSVIASYSGDPTYAPGKSPALTQVVQTAPTTTTLMSSLNPSPYNQSVTFTATVTGSSPTGTVTFTDATSGTTLGAGTLSGGTATFSTAGLTAGNHQVVASYGGDTDNSPSSSAPLTQTVTQVSTAVFLSSSVNPSLYSQSVTFQASLSTNNGLPTGTVTFTVDGTAQPPAAVTGAPYNAVASYTTSTLSVGSHTITATYNGDTNFTSATSSALTQTVNPHYSPQYVSPSGSDSNPGTQAAPKLTIQAAINSTLDGDTVYIAGGTYTGSGNVDLNPGGRSISLKSLSGDPTTTIIDCAGAAGANHLGLFLNDSAGTETVFVGGLTIQNGYEDGNSFPSGAIYDYNSGLTVQNCILKNNTASGGSGGAVYLDNETGVQIALLDCVLTGNSAVYGGAVYAQTRSSSIAITGCTLTGNSASNGSGVYSVNSANPAGSGTTLLTDDILYGDSGSSEIVFAATAVSAAYCDIQGGYAGTGNINSNPLFVSAPGDLHLGSGSPCLGAGTSSGAPATTIDGKTRPNPPSIGAYEGVPVATTLTVTSVSGTVGQSVTLSATLSKTGGSGLSGKTVAFSVDGTAAGTAVTTSTGTASLTYAIPAQTTPGSHTISVTFAGDGGDNPSSGTGTLTVSAASVGQVRFYPRSTYPSRMVGGQFQGSSDNANWTTLATVTSTPPANQYSTLPTSADPATFRYLRYLAPNGSYGNIAEIEFDSHGTKLTGTGFGTAGSYNNDGLTFQNALDGNTSTYFDAPAPGNGDYVGIDRGGTGGPNQVRFYPRSTYPSRMVGGQFQGSHDNSTWTTLATVTSTPPANQYSTLPTSADPATFRYLRYLAPNGSYGNVAEIEFDSNGKKLTGTGFGTAGSYNNDGLTFSSALDSNTSTYFDAPAPGNGDFVGIDQGTSPLTYTKLTGTGFGTAGSYNNDGLTFGNALDGSLSTYFDAPAPGSGDFVGIDLGSGHTAVVTRIDYCPRSGYGSRMVGGVFQGSNDNATWTALYTVTSAPATGVLTQTTAISSGTAYRYLRYLAPNGSYGNVAEVEFDTSP